MRLSLGIALGALLGAAQASKVVIRQNTAATTSSALQSQQQSQQQSSTTTPPASSKSTPATTSTPPASTSSDGGDTTVTVTKTVTGDVKTVTKFTTILTTVTSTVVVTSTDFTTTTVTSSDQATATKTVYETSTHFVNQKRGLNADLAPRTDAPSAAAATAVPVTTSTGGQGVHKKHLAKRATVTETTTVTVGSGNGGTTIVNSVVNTVKTVVTSVSTSLSIVTETEQANAKTTVTVTSTLIVTSTKVATGVVETSTGSPSTTAGGGGGGGGGDGNGSSDSGLSTGAKAGIGIGAALGALAVIGLVALFFIRRRRAPKPDHDDFMGASEVPVGGPGRGGPGSRGSHHMTETAPAAGYLAPARTPVTQSSSPEGYRGTAMGDGRAGYAKPAPYGSAYTSPSNTVNQQSRNNTMVAGDQLPRHPTPGDSSLVSPATPNTAELGNDGATAAKWHNSNAAEIDSQPVLSHHSGPVYEMPTQEYR